MSRETADVVVIGTGIIGAATAFYLAQAGLRVMTIDGAVPPSGATQTSTGMVRVTHHHPALTALAAEGLAAFQRWGDEVGESTFVRTGCAFRVDSQPSLADAGIAAGGSLVDGRALRSHFPGLRCPDEALAVWEDEAGHADPLQCTRQYLGRVGETRRAFVTALRAGHLDTTDGSIEADRVIIATGAWAPELVPELPVRPRRIVWQRLRVRHPRSIGPSYIDEEESLYARWEAADTILASTNCKEFDIHLGEEASPISSSFLARGRTTVTRRLGIEVVGPSEPIDGFDAFTPDGIPIIDVCEDGKTYLATGFCGVGFKLAPSVGRHLADWVLTGDRPGPLAAFATRT
ncbi:MAG: hypothetical protein QOK43_340 [Acidimicrobiaceae bacterium]|nr:hypothetical protein [Acidimicrobiaceae bacterium]